MPLEPCSADPFERKQLVEFLLVAFQADPNAPFINPDLLRWKYDEPGPDWPDARSFAWRHEGTIQAHAALCPSVYALRSGHISASYLIDWAASRTSAGAGVSLLRALSRKFDLLLAVGGSADTQAILPKLGYRHSGDLDFYVRVLRPWRQFRTDPFPRGWKAPLRLARNALWSQASLPSPPAGWSQRPITSFNEVPQELFDARGRFPFPCTQRSVKSMDYFMRCPGAAFSAGLIFKEGKPRGWYVLSRVGNQVRVADLWIDSESVVDWSAGSSLALESASKDRYICEVVTAASFPMAAEALRQAGFRRHHAEPIFLLDPKKHVDTAAPLNVTMLESDLAYHFQPSYPYLT
jgi:hypothetical protein